MERSRRQLSSAALKKQQALEKLRSLKQSGQKNRIVEIEESNVYEEIDEESYAKLVSKRQNEDWIVDDDGAGYAEHGREIFDDDDDDEIDDNDYDDSVGQSKDINQSKKSNDRTKSRVKYTLHGSTSEKQNKNDIRNMFNNVMKNKKELSNIYTDCARLNPSKTKKSLNEVKIDDNEIDDIIDSITTPRSSKSKSSSEEKQSHFQPLKLQRKQPQQQQQTPNSSSKKRKTFEPMNQLPFKRRTNNLGNIDFDEIIDKNELNTSSNKNIQQKHVTKQTIKEEPIDDEFMNSDHDFTLPDYNDDDIEMSTNDNISMNLKMEKFPEEEWIVSNNHINDNDDENEDNKAMVPQPQSFTNTMIKSMNQINYSTNENGDKLLKFYWFDAFYDANSHSDSIFLFGKIYNDSLPNDSVKNNAKDNNNNRQTISCCLQIRNLERKIFILPREYFRDDSTRRVQIDDVRQEFEEQIATKLRIKQFRSRKVIKRYAFEIDNISEESDYLEVLYPAIYPAITANKFMEGNTYRHIFGAQSSILENFILDKNLMGPCWLTLKNPEINDQPVSWCKMELSISKPKEQLSVIDNNDEQLSTPNFTILSLCFKTFVHVDTKTTEIVAISCLVNKKFNFDQQQQSNNAKYDQHFCLITKLSGKNGKNIPIDFNYKMSLKDYRKTKIEIMTNERELLTYFMAKFQQIDPDIIIGHDIYNYDYDILLQRFSHYKIPLQWSKLGRLKCSGLPTMTNRSSMKHLLHGRLVCDVKILARELLQRVKSYDLTELSSHLLRKGRFEIEQQNLPQYYNDSKTLLRLIEFLMKDNDLIISIAYELNCLQLCKQITNIAGNLLSRTLLGGRSERNEYLLLHAFNQRNFIVPDKFIQQQQSDRSNNKKTIEKQCKDEIVDEQIVNDKKSSTSYVGGLVLEPKIGFYDRFILLMDFNSLYPSIIQEYNICFTTIEPVAMIDDNKLQQYDHHSIPVTKKEEGILPIEIRKLVESRKQVKKQLYDPSLTNEQKLQLDIKQKALKITANSMYGCLGYNRSRFYAKHLASMITQKGREILLHTKELVEKMGYEVIYGDTDSIMILTQCTKYDDVKEIGRKIKSEVNKLYRRLEIDIDGVFRSMLLLKKKKYAALVVIPPKPGTNAREPQYEREIKGLDIIRRDWSLLAKMAGETVLDYILKPDQSCELIVDQIHQYLKQLSERLRNGQIDLELFVINKALAKRPEDYGEQGKTLTHVMIALRYNQLNLGKKLSYGDTVPFIICLDGTKNSATQRGYHLDEVRQKLSVKSETDEEQKEFRIDIDYYLTQQIFPVVTRLCEPLDGTDSTIIAEFLGIDSHIRPSINHSNDHRKNGHEQIDPIIGFGEDQYDCCESLKIQCPFENCKKINEIRDIFTLWSDRKIRRLDCVDDIKNYKPNELFQLTLSECQHCQQKFDPKLMEFYFELQIRQQINTNVIQKFGQRWMRCDDNSCNHRTRYVSGAVQQHIHLVCPKCFNGNLQPEISEHFVYQQLTFFHRIFDFDRTLQRFHLLQLPDEYQYSLRRNMLKQKYGDLFNRLQRTVQYFLDLSSYDEFDLGFLFRKFRYNLKK